MQLYCKSLFSLYKICQYCYHITTKRCPCGSSYCSIQCQKAHYALHKHSYQHELWKNQYNWKQIGDAINIHDTLLLKTVYLAYACCENMKTSSNLEEIIEKCFNRRYDKIEDIDKAKPKQIAGCKIADAILFYGEIKGNDQYLKLSFAIIASFEYLLGGTLTLEAMTCMGVVVSNDNKFYFPNFAIEDISGVLEKDMQDEIGCSYLFGLYGSKTYIEHRFILFTYKNKNQGKMQGMIMQAYQNCYDMKIWLDFEHKLHRIEDCDCSDDIQKIEIEERPKYRGVLTKEKVLDLMNALTEMSQGMKTGEHYKDVTGIKLDESQKGKEREDKMKLILVRKVN